MPGELPGLYIQWKRVFRAESWPLRGGDKCIGDFHRRRREGHVMHSDDMGTVENGGGDRRLGAGSDLR